MPKIRSIEIRSPQRNYGVILTPQAGGGIDPARGSEITVLRPGWLSSSLSSPPWRRATAEARPSPSPQPGCERPFSRPTKPPTPPPPSQPRTRLRATLFEADEALDRTTAFRCRNTATAIGDGQQDAIALAPCRHDDLCVGAIYPAPVFDGVVDQIGKRLADQLPVAVHRGRHRRFDLEMDTLIIGERLVEFSHPPRDFGRIDFSHVVARLA